jgi:[CysO sulfur-carrier protein]-S-L-cysteine hydrolase
MLIAPELLDELIAHAREEYDAECCGLLGYADGAQSAASSTEREPERGGEAPARAVRVHRATNVYASRKRFEIDGKELLRVMREFEDTGLELGAIYHSHTHTEPYPSQTDINFAANWPGLEWVIVGLAGETPQVRCFMIDGAEVREVPLEVR